MFARQYIGLTALAGLMSAAVPVFSSAQAQSVDTPVATAPAANGAPTIPAGTNIPPQTALAHGGQVVQGINGVSTAATPGTLGEDGLPSIDAAKDGNVAGLLSYCVRHQYGYGTTTRVIGRQLAKRPDVKSDQYYSLGGKGLLQTASSTPFDISTLDKTHATKLCSDLTKKGQTLTGVNSKSLGGP